MDAIQILLVEDNPEDRSLTIEALGRAKVFNNLHAVEDGVEALAFLGQQGKYVSAPRPDLILLDLNLPGKDGREVLDQIKSDPTLALIPVVVLTSSKSDEDILRASSLRVNGYLTK